MAYYALSRSNATRAYELLQESIQPDWSTIQQLKGSDAPLDLNACVREIESLLNAYPDMLSEGAAAKMEGEIGVVLHRHLEEGPATLDQDFWRWTALNPLCFAVLRRHQEHHSQMPKPSNFGLGSPVENFPYRAWLRATIGVQNNAPAGDRYSLALRGDQDFWRSHLLRQRYSFAPVLAHELIRFQFPGDGGTPTLKAGTHPDGIRELAKRLRRFQANCALSLLSAQECRELLDYLADGLFRSDGSIYRATSII
jgi:hypothetical protein